MKTIEIGQTKIDLSKLIDQISEGEKIIFTKNGEPIAELIRSKKEIEHNPGPRKPGYWKGKVKIADDFDEPLEEFEALLREQKINRGEN